VVWGEIGKETQCLQKDKQRKPIFGGTRKTKKQKGQISRRRGTREEQQRVSGGGGARVSIVKKRRKTTHSMLSSKEGGSLVIGISGAPSNRKRGGRGHYKKKCKNSVTSEKLFVRSQRGEKYGSRETIESHQRPS